MCGPLLVCCLSSGPLLSRFVRDETDRFIKILFDVEGNADLLAAPADNSRERPRFPKIFIKTGGTLLRRADDSWNQGADRLEEGDVFLSGFRADQKMDVSGVDTELLKAHVEEFGFFDESLLNVLQVSGVAEAHDLRTVLGFQHDVHEVILGMRTFTFRMGFQH